MRQRLLAALLALGAPLGWAQSAGVEASTASGETQAGTTAEPASTSASTSTSTPTSTPTSTSTSEPPVREGPTPAPGGAVAGAQGTPATGEAATDEATEVGFGGAGPTPEQLLEQTQGQAEAIQKLQAKLGQLEQQVKSQDTASQTTSEQVDSLTEQVATLEAQLEAQRQQALAAEQSRLTRVGQYQQAGQTLNQIHAVLETGSADVEDALSAAELDFQSAAQGASQAGGAAEARSAQAGLETVRAVREALSREDMQAAKEALYAGKINAANARAISEGGQAPTAAAPELRGY